MEHRLLLGGEQFLPFARSRIRALRALGLPYADQSFEIDGVSIKVRIEPGHEYIRLDGESSAYLESGQLETLGFGEENPNRTKPAKWHFLDIPLTDKYLGKIKTSPVKDIGKQKNTPILTEGMDSLAIGYPQAKGDDPDKAAKDAAAEDSYEEATVLKKVLCGYFPSSMFSGKMRNFVQALMGSKERKETVPGFGVEVLGTEMLLNYSHGGSTIRMGYWINNTPGLFTSDDYRYWVIRITGGPTYQVTAYKVLLPPMAGPLRDKIKAPETTPDERLKLEAYLLGNSSIDVSNPIDVGMFVGCAGNSMAYGWKFSMDGRKASVIVHETLGSGVADFRWVARSMNLTFTLTTADDTNTDTLSFTHETITHGEWTDGWGTNNIFVPETDEPGSPGMLYSLAINRLGVKPKFSFSNIPVYGYYKGDIWTPVVLSRQVMPGPFPVYTQESEGLVYDYTIDTSAPSVYNYGQRLATEGWSYKSSLTYEGDTMGIAVDGYSFTAYSKLGTHTKIVETTNPAGVEGAVVSGPARDIGGSSYTAGFADPPGYGAVAAASARGEFAYGNSTAPIRGSREYNQWVYTGWDRYAWALVIPSSDCEAAYISTHIYAEADTGGTQHVTYSYPSSTVKEAAYAEVRDPITNVASYVRHEFTPWCSATGPGWFGDATKTATITDSTPIPESTTDVFCFNRFLSGQQGAPGGSYYTLFNVEQSYPTYDRGMYAITGVSGRYVLSEGLKNPATAQFDRRFVGWA